MTHLNAYDTSKALDSHRSFGHGKAYGEACNGDEKGKTRRVKSKAQRISLHQPLAVETPRKQAPYLSEPDAAVRPRLTASRTRSVQCRIVDGKERFTRMRKRRLEASIRLGT